MNWLGSFDLGQLDFVFCSVMLLLMIPDNKKKICLLKMQIINFMHRRKRYGICFH